MLKFSLSKNPAAAQLNGLILLLSSSVLFTVHNWIIKVAKPYLNPWQIGFTRWVVGLIMVWLMAKAGGVDVFSKSNKKLLILRGIIGSIGYLGIVYATQEIPISQATVLFFVCPMFAALNGIWLNKQPIGPNQWIFIAGGFAGVVLVLEPGNAAFQLHPAHLIALGSAFCAGLSMAMMRKLASNTHPYTVFFFFCLVGMPISVGPALSGTTFSWPGWWVIGALLGSAVLGSGAQILLSHGFRFMPAHVGAVLLSSQVVFTAILGVVLLNEPLTWSMATGTCLVLGCGAMLSRKKKSRVQPAVPETGLPS